MNRILLYVHYNGEQELSPHVTYQLEHIRDIFSKVVFISNSELSKENQELLESKGLIDTFIQRENIGFDFGAWRDGMLAEGFENLEKYDSVTIMNDTCFGPVFDFETTFNEYENDSNNDFWGITNNRKHKVNVGGEVIIPDHIQSYFVSFKANVVKSQAFQNFWSSVEDIKDDVVQVILRYETQLTKVLEDAGFEPAVMFDTRKEDFTGMMVHDFSIFAMPEIVRRKIPFIKVKSFTFMAEDIYTPLVMETLERESDYPLNLIINHMTRVDYPDRNYMLDYKMLTKDVNQSLENDKNIAIHLHVFYEDLLEEFLEIFSKLPFKFDLYLTTDNSKKEDIIEGILEKSKPENCKNYFMDVTGNKGRDVLPWMKISDKLKNYDLVGHFHTKKSAANAWIVGETWRRDLEDMLLNQSAKVMNAFDESEQVGIVIPDVPEFFKYYYGPTYINEGALYPKMLELWNQIPFDKEKEFKQLSTYTMSYGTMLWYRPEALDNLLSLNVADQVPEEPLPYDSLLHAFERILVYVAWANGYDFRIVPSKHQKSGIIENRSGNLMLSKEVDTKQIDWDSLGGKRAAKYVVKKAYLKVRSGFKR